MTGKIILVMQRFHQADPTGYLLEKGRLAATGPTGNRAVRLIDPHHTWDVQVEGG